MNCREVMESLREGCPLDAAARRHLSTCATCAGEETFWRQVRGALPRTPPPPPFLHARIMAAIRAEARERDESRPWFQLLWVRRWALPAAAAALVVLGEGYGFSMALFKQVPDDLVVRWSEQQAILMAQNATPISPRMDAAPADEPASERALGLHDATALAVEDERSRRPSGGLPQPVPPPSKAAREIAGEQEDADGSSGTAPFEMARLGETQGIGPQTPPHPLRSQLPAPASAPAAQAKEESSKKDLRTGRVEPIPSSEPPGESRQDLKAKGRAEGPEGSSVHGRPVESPIPCRILSGGTLVGRLDLPAESAPPRGVPWTVTIDRAGRILSTEGVATHSQKAKVLSEALGALHLPEGTYTLTR